MTRKDPLLSKLRTPVHIDFIANYILKKTTEETRNILQDYIDSGIISESLYCKDYFVLTNPDSSSKKN